MSLITSVSGIRGTFGGLPGNNFTPQDIVKFTSAYGQWLKNVHSRPKVVIGRDGRISGPLVYQLVSATLSSLGIDVINSGLSTTPTVEMAVTHLGCQGGIIITASHNSKEWNALKLLNQNGEFLSESDANEIIQLSTVPQKYTDVEQLGTIEENSDTLQHHIDAILALPTVDVEAVRSRKFRVIADTINSTGSIALPLLFKALHVDYTLINGDLSGNFNHNPEPLPQHLSDLLRMSRNGFDLGIAVDPDVDRLAFVDENGSYFGEENTLVIVADWILQHEKGATVSNLSSSRALKDLTEKYGQRYFASPVGEVHVVQKMKQNSAVIGGEGNGGIIYPKLHFGRDALVGIALVLTYLAKSGLSLSQIKSSYTKYQMHKDKCTLPELFDYSKLVDFLGIKYKNEKINLEDGLKIDFDHSWVHLRKSNTEPIIRIYSEAKSMEEAEHLTASLQADITQFITNHV